MTIALCVVSPAFHCSPASPFFPVYLVSLVSCVPLVLCSLLSILSPLSSVLHCLSCLSDCRSFTSCVLVYFVYFVSFIFLGSLVSKVSCRCGSGGNCKMPVTLCLSFICINQFFLLDKVRIESSLQKDFCLQLLQMYFRLGGSGSAPTCPFAPGPSRRYTGTTSVLANMCAGFCWMDFEKYFENFNYVIMFEECQRFLNNFFQPV